MIDSTGPKISSVVGSRAVAHVREDGRLEEMASEALRLGPATAQQHPGAFLDRARDLRFHRLERLRRDERADVHPGVHRVAHAERADVGREPLGELAGDRLDHVDPLGRGAHLAGVEQAGPRDAGHGDVEIGVLEHDERVDAAELEVDLLELLAGLGRDPPARGHRAGEGDQIDARVTDQRLARVRPTGDDIDHSGRQPVVAPGHEQVGQRVLMRRLADDRVPRRQRRRDLPRHQQERKVERHDGGDDAERLLDREVELMRGDRRNGGAVAPSAHFGVVVEAGRDPLDAVHRLDQRLARSRAP